MVEEDKNQPKQHEPLLATSNFQAQTTTSNEYLGLGFKQVQKYTWVKTN
jgi:hypothetical protein